MLRVYHRFLCDVVNVIVMVIGFNRYMFVPMSMADVHRIEERSINISRQNLDFNVNDSTNSMKLQQHQQQQQKAVGRRLIRKERKAQHMTNSEFSSFPLSSSSSLVSSSTSEMQKTLLLQRTTDKNTIHHHEHINNNSSSAITNEQTLHKIKNKDDVTRKQEVQSLIEYIDSLGDIAKHFILFQWNTSGVLHRVSCSRSNWLPMDDIYNIFGQTRPSTYGTIAMLFNLDTIKHIPWHIMPPVPVMVYTIPYNVGNNHYDDDGAKKKDYYTNSRSNSNNGSSRYILVPNAYDRRGFSENAIEQVLQRLQSGATSGSSFVNKDHTTTDNDAGITNAKSRDPLISFEEFQSRANVIVWRGREVGEVGRKLLIFLAESQNNTMDGNNTSNRTKVEDLENINVSSSQKQHERKNHDDNRQHEQQRQQQQIWLDVAFTVSGKEERLRNEIEANKTHANSATNSTTLCNKDIAACKSLDGTIGKRLPREIMASKYKYQIDIGGISGTSWDGLRWKMCASGSVVFKVDTFSKDWWHDTIYPWVHYIPVQADLSNLYELYTWAEMNPIDAYTISINGQRTCLQTFTKEYSAMIQKGIIQALPPTTSYSIVQEANMIFQYNLTGITWEQQSE